MTVTSTTPAAADPGDDDRIRYLLTAPRGVDPQMDNLRPNADQHTIVVVGSRDLAQRLNAAEAAGGPALSWRRES